MVHLRNEAMRQVSELKTMKAGTLTLAAHESAGVYLLPTPLRAYVQQYPGIKVGIRRHPLAEIPRLVMDREVDLGFVKDAPSFHELHAVDVHTDELMLVAAPGHALATRADVSVTRCRMVAELWSFENVKNFVQEGVGIAIVPGITVKQELRDRAEQFAPTRAKR
jgi:DNA-binding transcriptional LysR family regulator